MADIAAWYAKERATMGPLAGRLMLGGVCYGRMFLDIFARYSLPSMLAKANREALEGAVLALYTDEETYGDLLLLLRQAEVNCSVRVMPPEVMAYSKDRQLDDAFWRRLSAAQALLVTQAARSGMPFHMFMPDQLYDGSYFPALNRLSAKHPRIAHNGLNVDMTAAPALERYRRGEALDIPAKALTDISWANLHWRMSRFLWNDSTPESVPACHFQLWRARDRVMMFTPHSNTAYMDAETCRRMDVPELPGATIDAIIPQLFGLDYYVPTVADDLAFIALEWPDRPMENPPIALRINTAGLVENCRRTGPQFLDYYTKPHELPASNDDAAPTAEEVMRVQLEFVERMRATA